MDHIPPGSSAYGILQARILEWVAISFCRGKGVVIEEVSKHEGTLSLVGLGEIFKSQRAT